MIEHLPDLLEIGESKTEKWVFVQDGILVFRCACGKVIPLSDACASSSSPFSLPICRKCAE